MTLAQIMRNAGFELEHIVSKQKTAQGDTVVVQAQQLSTRKRVRARVEGSKITVL